MHQSPYWQGFWRRRLSRRRLLATAALGGAGLAAASLVGCGQEPRQLTDNSPTPVSAGLDHEAAKFRGGTLRLPGFEAFVVDTLDPHQTQFGPLYSSHSAVFSKVLRYQNIEAGVITTDLAAQMPETPDELTYIVRLRPGVRFHRPSAVLGRSPSPEEQLIDGRQLTADDVKFSFERQMDPTSPRRARYYQAYQYATIDRIETVDDYTLRFITKEPIAPFLHYLADTSAFIIPKEAVDERDSMDSQEKMIGTGPFLWDALEPLIKSRFVRNPDWFGWDHPDLARPYIDAYESLFIADDATVEAAFRDKRLDSALQVSNPQWVIKVRQSFPELITVDQGFAAWLNSRLIVDRPPFQDFRVRKALHLAADRQQMIDALWQGWGKLEGPVSSVLPRWALPQEELLRKPGYRSGKEERQKDLQEARQLYEAAGSPPLEITFADQPPYIPAFMGQYQRHLEQVLGAEVKTQTRNYVQMHEGRLRGDITMTWQFDNGWIDLDDWLYPFFHSRGTKNTFRFADPRLDAMLEAQRREFDFQKRQQLGWDIQNFLLDEVLARLDYVSPTILWVAWPYYRNFRPSPFFGNSFWLANAWLDSSQPHFQERT